MPLFGPPDVQKLRAKTDIKGLIRALKHRPAHSGLQRAPELAIPRNVANALGDIKDPRAVEALIAVLMTQGKQDDPYLRQLAASGLGKLCDPRAVEALILALKDRDPNLRSAESRS